MDKWETIVLRKDEQPVPIIEPEAPVRVTPSKRKSLEKNERGGKQRKISEFLNSPKNTPKRRANAKAKNETKSSGEVECERQMEMMENDGITDWTEEGNSPELLDTGNANGRQPVEDKQLTMNDTVDFIQKFEMPSKRVFQFVQPSKKLTNICSDSLNGNNTTVKNTIDKTAASKNVTNPKVTKKTMPQPTALPKKQQILSAIDRNNKPFAQTKAIGGSYRTNADNFNRSTSFRKETKEDENRIETKATEPEITNDKNKSQNVYVPSCIKAMFGSQTVSQIVRRQREKEVHRKKDINFR